MKKNILKIIYFILAYFTRLYLSRTKPFIIGITGSVGKTSCRMIVYQILKQYEKEKIIYTSPKNFNSELGLVFSIFKIESFSPGIIPLLKMVLKIFYKSFFMKKSYDILLLEYGVDHPGDMDFLLTVAKPDISIFTKLDSIHIENFDSIDFIFNEKLKLIYNTKKKVFLNFNDNYQKNIFEKIKIEKEFYGENKISFSYVLDKQNIKSEITILDKKIKTNILGNENFLYIDLGLKILDYLKINYPKNINIDFKNQGGRFSIFKGINDSVLIDSTYNAGPESMKKMIDNTLSLREKLFSDYKIIFMIGDMRELGDFSKEKHIELHNYLKDKGAIISIGKETEKYFGKEVVNFKSSIDAGKYLKGLLEKNNEKYIVLFKGSQNTIFVEEALKQVLLEKNDIEKLVRQDKFWLEKK